jgi:hypothetical protein
MSKSTINLSDSIIIKATVKNTGNYDGEEVVQLYIRDVVGNGVVRPVKQMKGFEKVLVRFNDVVTMLDVSIVKVDLMAESRERVELDAYKHRMDSIKNNLENVQFSAFKIAQTAHAKDDEMINSLQFLVGNLKSEMKRINEMCNLAGMNSEHLDIIATSNDASI